MNSKLNLLLISNSFSYGKGYLDHCLKEIEMFLLNIDSVMFVPYALKNCDMYEKRVQEKFSQIRKEVYSLHHGNNIEMINNASSIFIGGGNTFRLLNSLYEYELLDNLRKRINEGLPYIGSSAGANILSPTIKTTNDMPIVEPPSFSSLNIITFQINPHYHDKKKENYELMSETREERIAQYFEENSNPVVGMRENSLLLIKNNCIQILGEKGVVLFTNDGEVKEYKTGSTLEIN